MIYILYNPLSRNGKGARKQRHYSRLIKKLLPNEKEFALFSLLELDYNYIISRITSNDKIIFVGGDGTLNRILNTMDFSTYPHDNLYLLKFGTGNDFMRSLKSKNKLVRITNYLANVPTITYDDKKIKFLNGVGIGLDGLITHLVNNGKNKNKWAYFKSAFKAFKIHQPNAITVNVDGKNYSFPKTWTAMVQNSPYIGGGMMVAPKADRMQPLLYLVVIHTITKKQLFRIFPTIYHGNHVHYHEFVSIIPGYQFNITCENKWFLQVDGNEIKDLSSFSVSSFAQNK